MQQGGGGGIPLEMSEELPTFQDSQMVLRFDTVVEYNTLTVNKDYAEFFAKLRSGNFL